MITVRTYRNEDMGSLLHIMDLNTPKYFDPSERKGFERYLQKETEDYFVVEKDGKTVGCGGLNYEAGGTEAVFSWGMIHPALHGKGLGTALCKHRMRHIRSQTGIERVIVRTSQHTQGFYSKLGFQLKKMENDYWGKGLHLYYMVQHL
ncbi:MAG: GNAT family N-acetyltransferase [Owenweeksia sp.]